MKVAYVSTYDPNDINQWSGLGYFMYKCIADQGIAVTLVNSGAAYSPWLKLKANLIKLFTGQDYQKDRDPSYLRKVAAKAGSQLKRADYDVVLSPGSLATTYLDTPKPVVFWTDATYDSLIGFYPEWKKLAPSSIRNGQEAERLSIEKASMIIFTSEWARANALRVYHADPQKVIRIPSGANIEYNASPEEIEREIEARLQHKEINLLFIGLQWERKGGDMAIETVAKLRDKGIPATLTVVGGDKKGRTDLPWVTYLPFVDKNQKEGVARLNELYRTATFFLLPTTADCFAVVFAEAGSHGLPVITTDVGGSPSAITDDYNGYCLSLQDFPEQAARKIEGLLQTPELYRQLGRNAYQRYQSELNWNVIGKKAVAALRGLLEKQAVKTSVQPS